MGERRSQGLLVHAVVWRSAIHAIATSVGLVTATLAAAAVPDSLSVEECAAIARLRAPARVATELDLRAAESESLAVSLNLRPEWSIGAGGTFAPKGFYDPAITNLGDYHAKFEMRWTASDGGRRLRERGRSALQLSEARWQATLAARDAGLLAGELAIRLAHAQRVVEARRQAVEWLDRLTRLIDPGIIAGTRTASEGVRVRLELDAAVSAFESARLDAHLGTLDLLSALGRDEDAPLVIRDRGAPPARDINEADSARVMATLDGLPEVQLDRISEALVQLAVEDAGRANRPVVELAFDAGLAGADLTQAVPDNLRATNPMAGIGDRIRRDFGGSASIQLHIPVFDPSARFRAQAEQSRMRATEARRRSGREQQRRIAVALLARSSVDLRQLAAAESTHAHAEENLIRVKSLYSGGATTLLDLLDAWRTYQDAGERLEDARQQSRLSQFQVEARR